MPGLFEQFPHTNLHELNLDWIIDLINQFKEELEDSAVLSVNGETGHVTLYESENMILPALPEGVDQWRLVRMMDGQYAGILFYNGNVYLQRGNETMRLLTLEDIPTSAGVVAWNGRTGVVNVTGLDIPVDDAADADSIAQTITNEHTERVNSDNALSNLINTLNNNVYTNKNINSLFTAGPNETNSPTARQCGKLVLFNFVGDSRTHTENEVIFTVASEIRPIADLKIPATIGGVSVILNLSASTGECTIFLINGQENVTSRLYSTFTYICV